MDYLKNPSKLSVLGMLQGVGTGTPAAQGGAPVGGMSPEMMKKIEEFMAQKQAGGGMMSAQPITRPMDPGAGAANVTNVPKQLPAQPMPVAPSGMQFASNNKIPLADLMKLLQQQMQQQPPGQLVWPPVTGSINATRTS
jgi:hypothetical protein